MKILFLTSPTEDYLADGLLHGLKSLYGPDVIDFPKCEILYRSCPELIRKQLRGNGFTLYSGLLNDDLVNRFAVYRKIQSGAYDLIIFSSIWRQYGFFIHFRPWLNPSNTLIFDGEDTPAVYPSAGRWWREMYYWGLPKAHKSFLYFKRELNMESRFGITWRLIPRKWWTRFPLHKNLRPTAFSFPLEKVVAEAPPKQKEFPVHIVDAEVAQNVPNSETSYAFDSEEEYYHDLRSSRYGITTKRGGWDCLRHYEIAANGSVICFRDLAKKPRTNAPHGLNNENCISYSCYEDLKYQLSSITDTQYHRLQQNSIRWVKSQTTIERAESVIKEWEHSQAESHSIISQC